MKSAVLVEQNPILCELYNDVLSANGFDVYITGSAMDAMVQIKNNRKDLMVIDTEIADELFLKKFVNKIQSEKEGKLLPIVGVSIYKEDYKKNIAKILDAFLTKPISIDRFIKTIFECIEKKSNDCKSFDN